MKAWHAIVVGLALVLTVASGAEARPEAAKQRVAIDMAIVPRSTFILLPLKAGAVKLDSGKVKNDDRGRQHTVMRDGQNVTIFDGVVWTLRGKLGTLTIRDRNEWVDVGSGGAVRAAPDSSERGQPRARGCRRRVVVR